MFVSVYLHNDLICLAVSNSIWFDDGNCVGFTGRNYRRKSRMMIGNADEMLNSIIRLLVNYNGNYCNNITGNNDNKKNDHLCDYIVSTAPIILSSFSAS